MHEVVWLANADAHGNVHLAQTCSCFQWLCPVVPPCAPAVLSLAVSPQVKSRMRGGPAPPNQGGTSHQWSETHPSTTTNKRAMLGSQELARALPSLSGKRCAKVLARNRAEFSAEVSSLLLIKASRSQERQYPIIEWVVPVMLDAVSVIN